MSYLDVSWNGRAVFIFAQKLIKTFRRQRTAKKITLHLVAVMLPQVIHLIFRFHSFGNHPQAQAVRERD
jgi:hypothetical protein